MNPDLLAIMYAERWPRMHVISDLHLDTGPYRIPADLKFDVLLAVGDIGPLERAIPWLAGLGKPVLYVLGNHEFYDGDLDDVATRAKSLASGSAVHVLHNDTFEICGVRFIGTMLWTNFGGLNRSLVDSALEYSNDYRKIRSARYAEGPLRNRVLRLCRRIGCHPPSPGLFHPVIAHLEHKASLAWLETQLAIPHAGPTVVLSHHSPSYQSLRARGVHEDHLAPDNWEFPSFELATVGNYASNMTEFLQAHHREIDLWCHGHLHVGIDVLDGGVRVLCNPRGYHKRALTDEVDLVLHASGPLDDGDISGKGPLETDAEAQSGDAFDFDAELVVDLSHGFVRPLTRAANRLVEQLEGIHAAVAELMPYLDTTDEVPARCVRKVFGDHCEEFGKIVDEALDQTVAHLDKQTKRMDILRTIDYPSMLPGSPIDVPGVPIDLRYKYIAQVSLMTNWINWWKGMPRAAEKNLDEWLELAQRTLQTLDGVGIHTSVEPPEQLAFRRVDARTRGLALILHANEDVADVRTLLNKQFNQNRNLAFLPFQISSGVETFEEDPSAVKRAMRASTIIRQGMNINDAQRQFSK